MESLPQLFFEFRQIMGESKIIYVQLPASDLIQPTRLKRIDVGGSKIAYSMNIDDTLALLIGNTDVQNPGGYWAKMVDQETIISDKLQEKGLLTANNRKTTIYLDSELKKAIPAYFSDKFNYLATQSIYVLDTKNNRTTPWKGNIFSSEDEMMTNFDKWRQIMTSFIEDIDRMYELSMPRRKLDCINYAIIKNDSSYHVRYFGFDFASKSGGCLELNSQQIDHNSLEYQSFKYDHLRTAVEYCMFQEYEGWKIFKISIGSSNVGIITDAIYSRPTNYIEERCCIW